MNDFERRIRQRLNPLSTAFTGWWCHSRIRQAWLRRSESKDAVHREATTLSKQARSALHDLRDSEAGKRAATTLNDLRDSDAGKRAVGAWNDLRQRESVRKAEAGARRALHDLRSGGSGSADSGGTTTS